jgi:aspartate dehydrogenase
VTVRKHPAAWYGTEAERTIDLAQLRRPVTLYQGPVRTGAARYPQNVNISAAAALAGIGLDRTELVVIADPTISDHEVEIEAAGAFGSFIFKEAVRPSTANPKTGVLVAMAAVKTLRQLAGTLVIGA